MSEIIENWLGKHVGIYVKMDSESIGDILFDGVIFAKLLVSFNICSSDYLKELCKPSSKHGALKNLRKLCVWFKLLGVSHGESFINEVASKNRSSCLRLLYELFVILENKERMCFLYDQKAKRLLTESSGRFEVERASLPPLKHDDSEDQNYLNAFEDNRYTVESFEKHKKTFIEKCIADSINRRKAINKLSGKRKKLELIDAEKYVSCKPCEVNVMEEIKKFEESLESRNRIENNEEVINCTPAEFVSLLKIRRRKSAADMYLKNKMERAVLCDAWKEILKDQENEFYEAFSKKLLKQSDYEKQMTLRLNRINLLYKRFKEDRKTVTENAVLEDSSENVFSSISYSEEEREHARENMKVLELHKKLFGEKKKLRKKKISDSCRTILEDIVDFAMLTKDFEKEFKIKLTKESVKYKEWKLLFIKGVPLLEHPPVPTSIPNISVPESDDYDFEDIINVDEEKIETVANLEFDMYLKLSGDWFVKQMIEIPSGLTKYFTHFPKWENCAVIPYEEDLNMVGYIIHRLLDMKYPYYRPELEPEIKNYDIKILLRTINDSTVISKLRILLEKSKIAVIEVQNATNFIIGSYKEATGLKEIKENVKKRGGKKEESEPVLKYESKEDKKSNFKSRLFPSVISEKRTNEVATQFPSDTSIFEEFNLQEAIYLGSCAYNLLVEGKKLPDSLICKAIIEYIKSLRKINGWVLVNFPESLSQIAILEFLFSSNEVPFMTKITDNIQIYINNQMKFTGSASDMSRRDSHQLSESLEEEMSCEAEKSFNLSFLFQSMPESESVDYIPLIKLKELKNSKLLPRPVPECSPPEFKSYFTKVIEVQLEKKQNAQKQTLLDQLSQKSTTEDEEEEEEEEEKEPELNLSNFYSSQGLTTIMYYKIYDVSTLKILGRIILGEDEKKLIRIDSEELFGPQMSEISDKSRKASKPAGSFNNNKSTVLKKHSLQRKSINYCDWEDTIDDVPCEEEAETEEEGFQDLLNDTQPGFKNWKYTSLPIEDKYQTPLATVWEAVEFFYIYNMKDVLALSKSIEYKILYYRRFILNKMEECLTLKDGRKQMTISFQAMLNNIDSELRSLKTLKGELHNRVFELQNKLEELCLIKKAKSEDTRNYYLQRNWLPDQLIKLIHIYRCMLQIEVDRFVDSMQIIQDYHLLCLSKQPPEFRLTKIIVPNLPWIKIKNISVNTSFKPRSSRKSSHPSSFSGKRSSKDMEPFSEELIEQQKQREPEIKPRIPRSENDFESTILLLLNSPSVDDNIIFSAHFIWQSITESLFESIYAVKEICLNMCNVENEEWRKNSKKDMSRKKNKSRIQEIDFIEGERESAEYDRLFLEWEEAINEEHERMAIRVQLIFIYVVTLLRDQLLTMFYVFNDFGNEIKRQFTKEMTDICKVCDIFKLAIEEERPIQPIIILEYDGFYIDPNVIMYPEIPPPPPTAIKEHPQEIRFTVTQLTNFYYKMIYVAPEGGIITQSFVLILEDMAIMTQGGEHPYLPAYWFNLSTEEIKYVVGSAFGDKTIINWKDFIVYGLEIDFPTLGEILYFREEFRNFDPDLLEVITYEEFTNTMLWFETQLAHTTSENLRLAKIKELLFTMFQISKTELNYTALLLAFCKDGDPKEGFVKALGLVDGLKYICRREELLLRPAIVEKESEDTYKLAYEVVLDILHRVFHEADDVIIVDIDESNVVETSTSKNLEHSELMLQCGLVNDVTEEGAEENAELTEEEQFDNVPWHSHIAYDTVLSLLLIANSHYTLSPDYVLEQTNLERNLRKIFDERGSDDLIELYVLLETPFMTDYFQINHYFQANNLQNLVASLKESKSTVFSFR